MRALVEVQGVVNRFGAQIVHNGIDMQVFEGEVFGIIGGSGAGKSVLLRTILGLRRPNAGSVRFLGRELASLSAAELQRVVHDLRVGIGDEVPEVVCGCGGRKAAEEDVVLDRQRYPEEP